MKCTRIRDAFGGLFLVTTLALDSGTQAAPPAPTIADIVEARSVDSLSLSPDGKKLAYRLLMPSLDRNRLEVQWRERNLESGAPAVDLGKPMAPIQQPLFSIPYDGMGRWNGQNFYVLAADRAGVQIHRLGLEGSDVRFTNAPSDIVDFNFDQATGRLRYHVFENRDAITKAQSREAAQGIHLAAFIRRGELRGAGLLR